MAQPIGLKKVDSIQRQGLNIAEEQVRGLP